MFYYPTFIKLYNQAQQDLRNAGFVVLPKSVLAILAYVMSGFAYLWFQFLSAIAQQSVPFTCTIPYLDAWAGLKSVFRKDATAATGVVAFTGTPATLVPSGTSVIRADGFSYATNADFRIGNSTSVAITALSTGSDGNAPATTALAMGVSVIGANSAVTLLGAITGGADVETDASLRSRMLLAFQNPPQGGDAQDYVEWALSVPGCTRAWCEGSGVGPGTVVVYPMFDITEATSNAATSGFPVGTNGTATEETRGTGPASGDQLAVAEYIYPRRPVTALVYVIAPQPVLINTVVSGLTVTTSTEAAIASSLAALYLSIGSATGCTIAPSQIYGAINAVVPTQSFDLISPAAVSNLAVGYLPVVGTATYL